MNELPVDAIVSTSDASPDPAFTQTLGKVNRIELVDLAIRAKRMAMAPQGAWLAPVGYTFLGAGLGGYIAGSNSGGVFAAMAGGAAFVIGSYFVRKQRVENAGWFCSDFMHFIDRWPSVSTDENNSDYATRRAAQNDASPRGLSAWWANRKQGNT